MWKYLLEIDDLQIIVGKWACTRQNFTMAIVVACDESDKNDFTKTMHCTFCSQVDNTSCFVMFLYLNYLATYVAYGICFPIPNSDLIALEIMDFLILVGYVLCSHLNFDEIGAS